MYRVLQVYNCRSAFACQHNNLNQCYPYQDRSFILITEVTLGLKLPLELQTTSSSYQRPNVSRICSGPSYLKEPKYPSNDLCLWYWRGSIL